MAADIELAACPCCRFPALSERGYYEICIVCWWEDDGQDDHNADHVRGGPNGRYSLTEARRNFSNHGHMYDSGQGIDVVEQPAPARAALIGYLRSVGFDPQRADPEYVQKLMAEAQFRWRADD